MRATDRRSGVNYHWVDDDVFVVDDTEFVVTADADRYRDEHSTADRFIVAKWPEMVDRLADWIASEAPQRIVELGIFKGGSAALAAALARPRRLTAIELAAERVTALDDFITTHALEEVVATHYGVDQSDVATLTGLLDVDHGYDPLDLVLDDASHLYRETRTSFEVLFARLRPGGLYVIEDWGWAHFPEPVWQDRGGWFHDRPALTNLIVEILMVAATGADLVSRVTVLRHQALIERGPLAVDGPLRIEDHYCNRGLPYRPLL